MKKTLFRIFLFLLFICFVSCSSTQTIYTMGADYGQLYFIRPTKVAKLPKDIKDFDFDITVRKLTETNTIDTPVLNFTAVFDKNHYDSFSNISFCFVTGNKKNVPQNPQILFKEIGNSKNLTIRFTSTLNPEEFLEMTQNPQDVKIEVSSGTEQISLPNKEFTQKLTELGVILL